jgi:peptidyl-prolyl cis-trans isomerase SurA
VSADFNTFKWRSPEKKPRDIVFSLGKDTRITIGDFMDYAQRASRERIRLGRDNSVEMVVKALYESFIDEEVLKYEERHLEEKYPEFKSLMREYEEGILLFEATKMLVWDKASQDTTGLKAFFDRIDKAKYQWDKRAVVSQYSLREGAKDQIEEVRNFASKHTTKETLDKFNVDENRVLMVEEKTIEKGRNDVLDAMVWSSGSLSHNEEASNRSLNFLKIEEVLPAGPKTLDEARGYIVADYQDYLEREWVKELRADYDVKINDKVFQALIKK